ncbi:NAD(P)-dependent oxidoreductase [Sulfurovum sp. XGS-02]|uniref:SDR family oxidoreductase n=1 Tax=Sulfurovum sp. XGS-02 TaxID=2925411 RepID=UPI002046F445|nr:NAD(P)-dependent oxidoreductase [Sulfurovum sp. XGS-02]UPT76811.1 NAD(P)-dependent oxidoreductase [Sulfurovum sp. XGS-02]
MSDKKVLVTGANGMLGSNILKFISYKDVIGFSHSDLDITDSTIVRDVLTSEKPDIIIHTAAFTNVEACEVETDKAYLINTIGTQNLVNYALEHNILFIYISSTGIYGKQKDIAYTEFDSVHPTTVHHTSKYEAEKIVQNHLNRYLILRTGWLYGGDKTHAKNYVYKRYLDLKDSDVNYSVASQIGNPTYVKNLVKQIEVLISSKIYGLYNCVDHAQNISRYHYVKKIGELFDLKCEVKKAPEGMYTRVAPVSHNESAINYKLDLLGLDVMQEWEVALAEYIEYLKK